MKKEPTCVARTFALPKDLVTAVDALADKEDRSFSAIVRIALRQYVEAAKEKANGRVL